MASSGNNIPKTLRAQAARVGRLSGQTCRLPGRLKPMHTLRQSVLLTLSVIFLVVLTTVGIGVSFFVTNSEKSAWHDRQLEATYGAARTIQAFLNRHIQTLDSVGLVEPEYLRTQPDLLAGFIRQNPALQEILVVSPLGNVLADAHRDQSVMASLDSIPESTWFLRTRAGGVYMSDVELSEDENPYLILSTPTQTGNIVAARVNMSILRDVVSNVHFGETGSVFIIDGDSNVIAHADYPVALDNLRLGVSPQRIENARAPMVAMRDEQGITHWLSTYPNFDGTPVASLIVALPGTVWYVVAEIDARETTTVSHMALLVLGGSIVVFATLVILFTVRVLDRRLFGPIALLRQGAQRIGAGKFEHRIADVGNNEIGQVATAFNEMASSLYTRQKQLVAQTTTLNEEVEQRRRAQDALQHARDELEAIVTARQKS